MNALSCNSEDATRQPHPKLYSPPLRDPLKQAAIANGALRINLRQFRRDTTGPGRVSAINRLLDASDAIGRALDWLRCRPGATDDSLGELIQLASDPHTIPDAVEAVTR